MRSSTRTQKGVGILAVIVCIGVLLIVVSTMTIYLARLAITSSRYAQGVRARALAEAGVETALANLTAGKSSEARPSRFELDGGSCAVQVAPDEKHPGRFTIVSEGRLKLSGGQMKSYVTLLVHVIDGDAGKSLRILSRKEDTRYVRTKPQKTTREAD